ncbi:type VII secretion protein EccB [Nocardia donostiensis]|uniref:Type VII secretion protein EccB n=1 Tax=Nocardia donostiensis TaxID=1538463 RepID=A0A1W0BE05_9NOCA|nr:type VII secretion protein EccB [Nocardia donostiensis]ONM50766.1 type VII secretion protein EccB [Nocardia donostiensis]OQS20842.1 type VII secretion protein EccB [Nocardia donostiensis]
MPSKPTTRWQVSGYRFLVRRMEHALVRRDVRMLHDPMRSQSRAYAVGLVLAIVVLAGCGVLALLRPQDKIGSNKILIGKETGAVYVVINDVVHPTLNLASARLAAGDAPKAVIVKESELGSKARGPLIGIPGAPGALHFDSSGNGRPWSVCDTMKIDGSQDITTSVIAGDPELGDKASAMDSGKALLVQGKDHTYLVYDNKRARVDMNDRAVTDALKITGASPRPVSEGLLNAIPEVLPIVPPRIDDPGATPDYPIGDHRIGEVVQVTTGEVENYVVLRDGLQRISELTADIIRNSNPQTSADSTIDQSQRTRANVSSALRVGDYPDTAPTLLQAKDQPVSCLSWKPITEASENSGNRAELSVITGVSLPMSDDAKLVPLAQADGSGPNADSAYLDPGSGAYVQTTGIEPDSTRKDSLFYIADTGVRYGIKNAEAVKALGMPEQAEPAPWPIVGLLAAGPSLGREEALVAHDGVAPDPSPAKEPVAAAEN